MLDSEFADYLRFEISFKMNIRCARVSGYISLFLIAVRQIMYCINARNTVFGSYFLSFCRD